MYYMYYAIERRAAFRELFYLLPGGHSSSLSASLIPQEDGRVSLFIISIKLIAC